MPLENQRTREKSVLVGLHAPEHVGVEQAVAVASAAAYRVRIDFRPDGRIDRDVVDAIIADNVKAEMTLS